MNTPEPERLSAVAVVSVDPELLAESSLPPQEIMAGAKPIIKKVYKKIFINFLNLTISRNLKINLKNNFIISLYFLEGNLLSTPYFITEC